MQSITQMYLYSKRVLVYTRYELGYIIKEVFLWDWYRQRKC